MLFRGSLNFCSCTTWFLDLKLRGFSYNQYSIIYKDLKVLDLQANACLAHFVRHWTPKPMVICSIRSSPTWGNFYFAVVKSFEYKIAISANFAQTVKNSPCYFLVIKSATELLFCNVLVFFSKWRDFHLTNELDQLDRIIRAWIDSITASQRHRKHSCAMVTVPDCYASDLGLILGQFCKFFDFWKFILLNSSN